jgi:hypothetical protein
MDVRIHHQTMLDVKWKLAAAIHADERLQPLMQGCMVRVLNQVYIHAQCHFISVVDHIISVVDLGPGNNWEA